MNISSRGPQVKNFHDCLTVYQIRSLDNFQDFFLRCRSNNSLSVLSYSAGLGRHSREKFVWITMSHNDNNEPQYCLVAMEIMLGYMGQAKDPPPAPKKERLFSPSVEWGGFGWCVGEHTRTKSTCLQSQNTTLCFPRI
jgi:hypothetical protein